MSIIRTNFNNERKNPIESKNGKPLGGRCLECGCFTSEDLGGRRVTLPSQQNGVWMCKDHRGLRNLNSYFDENDKVVGTPTSDGITCSCELEYMGRSTSARAYLVSNGFKITSDCTVDGEAKSPIYASLNSFSKVLGGIEFMNTSREYEFDVHSDEVGLHTHFGYIDNRYNMINLSKYWESLTSPLNDVVSNGLTCFQREEIFGSDFRGFATRMRYNSYNDYSMAHENWINLQHDKTIEFRLFRFTNAKDYAYQVKVFREIFKTMTSLFTWIDKYNNDEKKIQAKAKKLGIKAMNLFVELNNLENDSRVMDVLDKYNR